MVGGDTVVTIQKSLEIYRDTEEKTGKGSVRCHLGTLARKRGNLTAAEDHLTASLTLCRDGDGRHEEATSLVERGELSLVQDEPQRARTQFGEAVEIYREMGAVRDAVKSLERLAEICEILDDEEAALTHYDAAAALVDNSEFLTPCEALTERCATLTDTALDADGD